MSTLLSTFALRLEKSASRSKSKDGKRIQLFFKLPMGQKSQESKRLGVSALTNINSIHS